jgi:hypothetical protein
VFLRRGVVSTSPNPQVGGPPFVGCPRLLIQFIHSYPPYWRPFLHPQPEDAPCRGDRDPRYCSHYCYYSVVEKVKHIFYLHKISLRFHIGENTLCCLSTNIITHMFVGMFITYFHKIFLYLPSFNKSQQDALFLNFISVKNSTCFGQIYCPSSGVLILYSQ